MLDRNPEGLRQFLVGQRTQALEKGFGDEYGTHVRLGLGRKETMGLPD